jgi:hypothetical protein
MTTSDRDAAVMPQPTGRKPRWPWPPTRRELDFCRAVQQITAAKGRAPSWREMGDALGIASATVRDLGWRASLRGLVTWRKYVPYSIRLVHPTTNYNDSTARRADQ